ncbi:MAG: C10 family peptidase [Candidatus Aminicenantes bacterium]|nr:C10 family peptidase [Candidatus Aminicenantes bacterium]
MKKLISLLILVIGIFASVPPWKAMEVALKWVSFMNQERGNTVIFYMERKGMGMYFPREFKYELMQLREVFFRGEKVGYVAELFPSGYILIPDTEIISPVKFYSFSGKFDPDKIGFHKDLVFYLYRAKRAEDKVYGNYSSRWTKIMGYSPAQIKAMADSEITFGPIVETRWNQGWPYNKYTPVVGGNHTPTGCVATAFAQIMKFWSWPDRGKGSYTYYWESGGKMLSADFNHPYHWDLMPVSLNSNSPQEQIDAVARLMYDVGVAVEMDYAPGGSGAYPEWAIYNFPKFFKYSSDMTYILRCNAFNGDNCVPGHLKSANQWVAELRRYLDRVEPIEFSIYGKSGNDYTGHAVVVDGYRIADGQSFIHINMGWGGNSDGFYSVDNILDFNLTAWEYAIVNIYPENQPARPRNVKAVRKIDRGIFVHRYYDEVTWDPPSTGASELKGYEILRWDVSRGFVKVVASVQSGEERIAVTEAGTTQEDYRYAVRAISKEGKRGHPSVFVSVEREE